MRAKKPNGYWQDLNNCIAEAKLYETRSAWQKGSPLSYRTAAKNGWLADCSAHMQIIKKPDGYWTLERCKEKSLKYRTKAEWRLTHRASFSRATKQGWLKECTAHMEKNLLWFGPASILEFLIANDIEHFQEYRFKESVEISRRPYDFYLPEYKLVIEFHGEQHRIGWGRKIEDAKSIQARDLFKKNWALENGLNYLEILEWEINSKEDIHRQILEKLMAICKSSNKALHLTSRALNSEELEKVKSRVKWTYDKCVDEAKKYQTIKEWNVGSPSSYQAAFKKGWIDDCSSHMVRLLAPKNYWTKERCIEDAKKYTTRQEWSKGKLSGYAVAASKGWLKLCCDHMKDGRFESSKKLWTYEKCLELAKKCKSRAEFKKLSGSAYQRARVEGWLEDCCNHMK